MKTKAGVLHTFPIAKGGPGWITVGAQNWQPVEIRVGSDEITLKPVRQPGGGWVMPTADAVIIEAISNGGSAGGIYLSEAEALELVMGLAKVLDLTVKR